MEMVHYLDDRNINNYKKGIQSNDYEFYDIYKDVPEVLFLGRSNVGKSSLINAIFRKEIASSSKRQGKTQRLEFFLVEQKNKSKLFFIDAPGFGYVDGPVVLRRKFKYLIYTYLNYAVRLNQIVYLINGHYGMEPVDRQELKFLNNFGKHIQLVFTKVDKLNNSEIIKYMTEASQFTKDLVNVRQEILITSSKTKYGIENLRTHLMLDLLKVIKY
jgi:GTP-binding protein